MKWNTKYKKSIDALLPLPTILLTNSAMSRPTFPLEGKSVDILIIWKVTDSSVPGTSKCSNELSCRRNRESLQELHRPGRWRSSAWSLSGSWWSTESELKAPASSQSGERCGVCTADHTRGLSGDWTWPGWGYWDTDRAAGDCCSLEENWSLALGYLSSSLASWRRNTLLDHNLLVLSLFGIDLCSLGLFSTERSLSGDPTGPGFLSWFPVLNPPLCYTVFL